MSNLNLDNSHQTNDRMSTGKKSQASNQQKPQQFDQTKEHQIGDDVNKDSKAPTASTYVLLQPCERNAANGSR